MQLQQAESDRLATTEARSGETWAVHRTSFREFLDRQSDGNATDFCGGDCRTSGTDRTPGGRRRPGSHARHARTSRHWWVKQVNCNCTDFTDSTDRASASKAPRTRAEPLWGARVARSSHPACPRSFRERSVPQTEAPPPLGAIREIAAQIRVIVVQAVGQGSRARHRRGARTDAASSRGASATGQHDSLRHSHTWCQIPCHRRVESGIVGGTEALGMSLSGNPPPNRRRKPHRSS
jgi:hypothetical protein